MNSLPQPHAKLRSPRLRLEDFTPAVLRFQDGQRAQGKLQIVSLTGGLLCLPTLLERGTFVKLMFLTQGGPVLGAAEMLNPVATTLQPFRFLSLPQDDKKRLTTTIYSCLDPSAAEDEWIQKFRNALAHRKPPRRRLSGMALGAVVLGTLCLVSALCILHFQVLK